MRRDVVSVILQFYVKILCRFLEWSWIVAAACGFMTRSSSLS